MRLWSAVSVVAVAAAGAVTVGWQAASGDAPEVPSFASLSGAAEAQAADPDGVGSASVTIDGTTLCFGITVANIGTPIGAHIHRGLPEHNGPIVVHLAAPTSGDPGSSSGCVSVAPALAGELQAHRERFYVNVHTGEFPGGAVRGQLFRR